MSYADYDLSVDVGQPVELFEFLLPGTAVAWRYTSGVSAVTYGGNTYQPLPIERGEIERSAGAIGSRCQIELPSSSDLAVSLMRSLAAVPVTVKIYQIHGTDAAQSARIVFQGYQTAIRSDAGKALLECGPRTALSSKRKILWPTIQQQCNWAWGTPQCGVNADSYKITEVVAPANQVGRVFTAAGAAGFADDHFSAGWVQRASNSEKRFIESHTGADLLLQFPFYGLQASESFDIYPGCKQTEADCANRYSNLPNFLGWARMPTDNPYLKSAYYLSPAQSFIDPGDTWPIPGFDGYYLYLTNWTGATMNAQVDKSTPSGMTGGVDFPIIVSRRLSLSVSLAGQMEVTLREVAATGTAQVVPYTWIQPTPYPVGLDTASFEMWVENMFSPSDASLVVTGNSGNLQSWRPIASNSEYYVDFEVHTSSQSTLTYQAALSVFIRYASDGLIKVAGVLTIPVEI